MRSRAIRLAFIASFVISPLVFAVTSKCSFITTVAPCSWPDFCKKLESFDPMKKPYWHITGAGDVQVRIQVLTPFGQASEAYKKALEVKQIFTQSEADGILANDHVIVRTITVASYAPSVARVHAVFLLCDGEQSVQPLDEKGELLPQGSQYRVYTIKTDSLFSLKAIEEAHAKTTFHFADGIVVNYGQKSATYHFHVEDLE
jgi:hypothetical protein